MRIGIPNSCIIYCRVSSEDQIEGTSLESQERICSEYARQQGWSVLETFVERGESAKTAARTELQRALAFCRKKKADFFVVYKLDRFARNQNDHITVRALLRRYGTELRSATEPIDDTPTGRLMEGVLSSFAQFDNDVRAERSKQGMLERIKQGIWVWPSPLGYHRPSRGPGSNIAPDPKVAPLIRLAFEEYAKGAYTYEALARWLAERGLTTTNGRAPRKQLIQRILTSSVYCGIINVWGEQHRGTFEPIVSPELFEACRHVQRRTSTQPTAHTTDNPLFPLRRLVVCKACRQPLTGGLSTGRNGRRYPYYHHYPERGCPVSRCIPKAALEEAFANYLGAITPNARFESLFREVVRDFWEGHSERNTAERARAEREIAKLEHDRQQIFELHREGVYSNAEFREQLRINQERIKEKHVLLNENVPDVVDVDAALDDCFRYVKRTADVWKELEQNHATRMRFQNQVFEGAVEFDGERFGNATLSLVYTLFRETLDDKSRLVALVEQNWKQVTIELQQWTTLLGKSERT